MAQTSSSTKDYVAHDSSYTDTYAVYRRGLLEQQRVWINEKVVPVVSESLLKPNLNIRILSVGSGEGDIDTMLLDAMIEDMKEKGITTYAIDYVVVERNSVFVDQFRCRVKERGDAFASIKFNFIVGTLEEAIGKFDNAKFDFIHLIHCLYYMDPGQMLQNCIDNCLKAGGILMAVVQSEASIYSKNWRKFSKELEQHVGFFNLQCETEMKVLVDKIGLKNKIESSNRVLDVTDIVKEDGPNGAGFKLLDFFFHSHNLQNKLKTSELNQITEFLKANTVLQNGRHIGPGNETIVFLFK